MFFPVRRPPFGFIALVVVLTLIPLVTDAGTHAKKLPKCCVWRVTNATAPFYLVGSIHALGKKDYPLPKPDRKSTRLNSSHTVISYAVFCLKKKKKEKSSQQAELIAQ